MQSPQWQAGEQANRVEMAGVIRDQNEGPVVAEMLFANDLEAAIRSQQSANDQRDERAQSIDEHVRVPGKIPEPLDERLVEIGGGFVLPAFHRSLE